MDLRARRVLDRVRSEGRTFVTEPEAKEVLRAYGVPVTRDVLCRSPEEATEAARGMGYPVVVKLVSKQVVHKTELGGVRLGVGGDEELRNAWNDLESSAAKAKVSLDGILVSETAEGVEMIIGSVRDPQFGHMIMVGMGGTFVEIYRDVAYRIVPLEELDAKEMISELKGARLLHGYRGRGRADMMSLIRAIIAVSKMLADFEAISEMDLNPVFVSAKGVMVADARMVLSWPA